MNWSDYASFPATDILSSRCNINDEIRRNDKIRTSWGYREYMQRNANTIMDYNTKNALTHSNTNVLNIINRGAPTVYSDLMSQYLRKQKVVLCPSIPMI